MIKLGLILTIFVTIPIILFWCLYHIGTGFMKGHREYKKSNRRS